MLNGKVIEPLEYWSVLKINVNNSETLSRRPHISYIAELIFSTSFKIKYRIYGFRDKGSSHNKRATQFKQQKLNSKPAFKEKQSKENGMVTRDNAVQLAYMSVPNLDSQLSNHSTCNSKEKKLAIEEKKVGLEEKKLKLEEDKFQLEKKLQEDRLVIEIEERRHRMMTEERQQKLIDALGRTVMLLEIFSLIRLWMKPIGKCVWDIKKIPNQFGNEQFCVTIYLNTKKIQIAIGRSEETEIKRRRIRALSSSSEDASIASDHERAEVATDNGRRQDGELLQDKDQDVNDIVIQESDKLSLPRGQTGYQTQTDKQDNNEQSAPVDMNILALFGEDPLQVPTSSVQLQPDLVSRWNNILSNGLPKERRDQLLHKYPKEGRGLLDAPILNLEVVSIMQEPATKRDAHLKEAQEITGLALVALGHAISSILNEDEEGVDRANLLENLADTGKLLAELHHIQSTSRRAFITPGLNKELRQVLADSKVEGLLFGNNLQERIREAKAMERTARKLKPTPKQPQAIKQAPSGSRTTISGGQRRREAAIAKANYTDDKNSGQGTDVSNAKGAVQSEKEELNQVSKVAGRLKWFLDSWKLITKDKIILDIVKGYKIVCNSTIAQSQILTEPKRSIVEEKQLQLAVLDLFEKGAIESCTHTTEQFISLYFLVPKPDATSRFILNLKNFNSNMVVPHFKLENMRSVIQLLTPGMFLSSIDLQDAYFLRLVYTVQATRMLKGQ
ncbi:hypothetical protein NQ315_015134 [Exocentrus adspersus]|uniref:Uncharacterized protein n=1 Tax=Exocentrus adspersus TaxID=1586481 RepID=A0AAV8V5H5_9CUCU|nr:hypothetical protein NQ315_015134 [Exocentrus adspersus]